MEKTIFCKVCKETKGFRFYHERIDRRMGKVYYGNICRACVKELNRKRYLADREHKLDYAMRYREGQGRKVAMFRERMQVAMKNGDLAGYNAWKARIDEFKAEGRVHDKDRKRRKRNSFVV